jgi:hypothetical protein
LNVAAAHPTDTFVLSTGGRAHGICSVTSIRHPRRPPLVGEAPCPNRAPTTAVSSCARRRWPSPALTRICRLLSGIKLHTGEWTLADAQRCFEREAYVAAPAAKREAERGTYDPTYGGYFLGKRGLLTLRDDYAAARGAAFNLREFHERVMSNGIAPIWAHRQLLLPGDSAPLIR